MNNIPVVCRTNLDLRGEQWPISMPAIPSVGHRIKSNTYWNTDELLRSKFQLVLEVVAVGWEYDVGVGNWIAVIELHIPKHYKWTIKEFYDWYAPKVGKSPSAFI
jgi:hypothetical protein